jgi:cytochrome P450
MEVAIVDTDPPEHTRLRNFVSWAFTPRRVKQLQPGIERRSLELIAAMRAHGAPADLVGTYALRLPIAVICDLLDIPESDHELMCSWADAAVSSSALSDEEQMRFYAELGGYMTELIARRREHPGDDLISALVSAQKDGQITEHELLELAVVVLVAGNDTTANQLANCAYVLLTSPGHWQQIRADPDLVPAAVEELVRYIPLSSGILQPRVATEDVELGGQLVRAGDVVLIALESANRDENVFADGESLCFARQPNPHLGYSHGPHYCLGAALARRELEVAVRHWTGQLPEMRLAIPADTVRWKSGLLVRGPAELPVTW